MKYNRLPAVYVAGPYRALTREGIELNIQAARQVGLMAARKGWAPLIPHSNTAHLDTCAPDVGEGFWLAMTMELMRRCDAVVLCPGWERSSGTLAEIEEAKRLGLPVFKTVELLTSADLFRASQLIEHEHSPDKPATMPSYEQALGRAKRTPASPCAAHAHASDALEEGGQA